MLCNMILTDYGSISSIVGSEEEEENAIAIDRHNYICYERCASGYSDMVYDGYCHSWNSKSENVF